MCSLHPKHITLSLLLTRLPPRVVSTRDASIIACVVTPREPIAVLSHMIDVRVARLSVEGRDIKKQAITRTRSRTNSVKLI